MLTIFLKENHQGYIVMEYVNGKSLEQIMEENELPTQEAIVYSCYPEFGDASFVLNFMGMGHDQSAPTVDSCTRASFQVSSKSLL